MNNDFLSNTDDNIAPVDTAPAEGTVPTDTEAPAADTATTPVTAEAPAEEALPCHSCEAIPAEDNATAKDDAEVPVSADSSAVPETPIAEEISVAEDSDMNTSAKENPPQPVYTQPVHHQAPPYQAPASHPVPPAAPPMPPYGAPFEKPAAPKTAPQYYYGAQPVPPAPPSPQKKKKSSTAFLICLWVLIGLFAVGFFVMCGYVAGQHSNTDATRPTLFDEYATEPEATEDATDATKADDDSSSGIIPLPDSDDVYSTEGSIALNDLPTDKSNTDKYSTQYAYKKVAESTIGVVCYTDGFSGEAASQGTGIILTEDGYIATNSHVIGDSRTAYNVQVVTNDGTTYEAKVIGYDSRTDLAVLKINANNLTPAEFCDSDLVEVGIDVIAVGNPGGMDFQNSLTRGVVSALNRELSLSAQVTYIQTDAAINPGNSGGPLCNMYGQVIGITTAKISSESVEGMGFAIPSRTVKEIVDDLMTQGYVSDRVRLGISGQAVTAAMEQYYSLPQGILVGEISEGGPCDGTDLKINDIITEIDGEAIADFSDVYSILGEHKPGDEVVLTVYRMDANRTFEITVTLMADEGQTQQ